MVDLRALLTLLLAALAWAAPAPGPGPLTFPLEVRRVRNWSRDPDLFSMSRHALHYDLLLTQNRDRSLYMFPLLFTAERFTVKVVADTGSSILWINGLSCTNKVGKQTCGTFVSYFKYGYLDGPIEGDMVTTEVALTPDAVSKDTYVLLVRNVKEDMDDPLVGLGPRTSEFPTFMERLVANGLIEDHQFTIDLVSYQITFGRHPLPGHQAVALPLTNPLGYYTNLDRVALFGKTLFSVPHDCIFDSGNTLVAIPALFTEAIMAAYRDAGWVCRTKKESNPAFSNILCDVRAAQPFTGKMTLKFGAHEFLLEGEDLWAECISPDADGKRVCKSIIEVHDFNNGIIMGQPFFARYPVTFNLSGGKLEVWRRTAAALSDGLEQEGLSI